MEHWALIRRLHLAEGERMRSIVERLGIPKNDIEKAVALHIPASVGKNPKMTTTVIV